MDQACTHLDAIHDVSPRSEGCEDCLKTGDTWVHLRYCLSCGHVGCCDSSKNKHARAHFHGSGHPLIQSREPGREAEPLTYYARASGIGIVMRAVPGFAGPHVCAASGLDTSLTGTSTSGKSASNAATTRGRCRASSVSRASASARFASCVARLTG